MEKIVRSYCPPPGLTKFRRTVPKRHLELDHVENQDKDGSGRIIHQTSTSVFTQHMDLIQTQAVTASIAKTATDRLFLASNIFAKEEIENYAMNDVEIIK